MKKILNDIEQFLKSYPALDFSDSNMESDCFVVSANFIKQSEFKNEFLLIGGDANNSEMIDFHVAIFHKKTKKVIDLTYGQFDIKQPIKIYSIDEFKSRFNTSTFLIDNYFYAPELVKGITFI